MLASEYRYVDTAFGGPARRNRVMPLDQVEGHLPQDRTDCLATWHRFPQAYQDHWQRTGRVGGYTGPSYADYLPFDFDGEDLEAVLAQVRQFLKRLELTYELDGLPGIRGYFSGRKGFHLLLSSHLFGGWEPSLHLYRHLRQLALTLAQEGEVDRAIYDQNRLLRLPLTRHGTSGLWKIPLTVEEILTLSAEAIRICAQQPRQVDFPPWEDAPPSAPCVALWQAVQQARPEKAPPPPAGELFPTGMKEGEGRDHQAFRIACHFRHRRLPREEVLAILRLWDTQQEDPLGETVLAQKVQSAFRQESRTGEEEITPADIKTPAELVAAYQAYIDQLKARKVTLGWAEVDEHLRGIAPGEVLTLIAKAGVGKTAVLQNILRHIALSQDAVTLFCSLEQPLAQVFERYAQMSTGEAGRDIELGWQEPAERERLAATVVQELGPRTLTCGRAALTLPQLDQALEAAQVKAGQPVHLLAIDYLGLLDTTRLDGNLYGQVSRAARELKSLAKRRDLAILCLGQVSRAQGEDGSKPLTLYAARESGAIEEAADFLLGLYRPDLHGADRTLAVQLLKNRKGQHGLEFTYPFDKKSLRLIQPQGKGVRHEY